MDVASGSEKWSQMWKFLGSSWFLWLQKKLPGLQKKENEKKLTLNVTSVNIFAIGLWAQSLISGYNK